MVLDNGSRTLALSVRTSERNLRTLGPSSEGPSSNRATRLGDCGWVIERLYASVSSSAKGDDKEFVVRGLACER